MVSPISPDGLRGLWFLYDAISEHTTQRDMEWKQIAMPMCITFLYPKDQYTDRDNCERIRAIFEVNRFKYRVVSPP